MVLKKSDLYSSLWKSCDELRGGMDASQYKDYILTLLFVKYVSDKYQGDDHGLIDIPPGGSFKDIWELKGKPNIGEGIDKVIGKLAEANDLRGVIDVAFFNDDEKLGKGKEMVDRLSKLVSIFNNLDFRSNRADGDDLLGDAYEYLMRHFATESGKSKGQFYTPAEVSRILARVIGIGPETKQNQTVYDPTAGSGSLLLKAADEAPKGLSIYGQEKDVATWALAKMNMILHGYETAVLEKGDTITSPAFTSRGRLKLHDFVVANPPFSTKSWRNGINPSADEFGRFEFGVPPTKNGDYAFLLHAVKSLKSKGKAAVILPHGVLFRGNTEAVIRKNLIRNGLVKGIIGLPPNLFYGTGIPACIVVIDKEDADGRAGVFMVDASRGFIKDGNKNRLRSQDLHKIVDTFNSQAEVEGYSRFVSLAEISSPANDFNLNISRYIDSSAPDDVQDLDAHLRGGIPDRDIDLLEPYWSAFPGLRKELFSESDRPGYTIAAVGPGDVHVTIKSNHEFQIFRKTVAGTVTRWYDKHRSNLMVIDGRTSPRALINDLSESLLLDFKSVPLLSRYDAYECLMTYWGESMQDDVYLVLAEGWEAAAKPHVPLEDKERKIVEQPDLVIGSGKTAAKYKMDLIPPELIVARFFSAELEKVIHLKDANELANAELTSYIEEHGGEGGLVEDVVNEKGKVTKAAVTAHLKLLQQEPTLADELGAVTKLTSLIDTERDSREAVRDAQSTLAQRTLAKYGDLSEAEIKTLVVDHKWISAIESRINVKVEELVGSLAQRISLLELRYAKTLPALVEEVEELSQRVDRHLEAMGAQR